jgi:hypothetical protein
LLLLLLAAWLRLGFAWGIRVIFNLQAANSNPQQAIAVNKTAILEATVCGGDPLGGDSP